MIYLLSPKHKIPGQNLFLEDGGCGFRISLSVCFQYGNIAVQQVAAAIVAQPLRHIV